MDLASNPPVPTQSERSRPAPVLSLNRDGRVYPSNTQGAVPVFVITKEWRLKVGHEKNGMWNREQLEIIGIEWPPKAKWAWKVDGIEITEDQKLRIERSRVKSLKTAKETHERHVRKMAQRYYTWTDGKGSWTGSAVKPDWWDKGG